MTILPKSSTRRTIPVAVPDICLRRRRSLASVDRGHSLRQSTSHNIPFPTSGKLHLCLGFSSPHKAGFVGSPFLCICHRRRSHRSPVAFIYLSPFLGQRPPCLKGAVTEGDWGILMPLCGISSCGRLSLHRLRGPPPSRRGRLFALQSFYKLLLFYL